MKVALLPAVPSVQSVFATKSLKDLKKANFGDIFNISLPANKIFTKTLQINVWNKFDDREKCVVSEHYFIFFYLYNPCKRYVVNLSITGDSRYYNDI